MDDRKSFFEQLSPKSAMLVGLVGGIMTLCTIGFFVMLGLYVRHGFPGRTTAQVAVVPSTDTAGTGGQTAPSGPVNVGVGHFPGKGDAKAPVTIIEFADFRCPFCERFYTETEQAIMRDYVATGKAKFYFRSFAFLGPESTAASEAAECANDQGKFWEFYDWMFKNQAPESDLAYYSQENLIKYAVGVGVNKAKFTECMTTHKFANKVQEDLNDGQAAGVNGTPTTFINGVPVVGAQPYATVKQMIEKALQGS